jgi:hypothetical protein
MNSDWPRVLQTPDEARAVAQTWSDRKLRRMILLQRIFDRDDWRTQVAIQEQRRRNLKRDHGRSSQPASQDAPCGRTVPLPSTDPSPPVQ